MPSTMASIMLRSCGCSTQRRWPPAPMRKRPAMEPSIQFTVLRGGDEGEGGEEGGGVRGSPNSQRRGYRHSAPHQSQPWQCAPGGCATPARRRKSNRTSSTVYCVVRSACAGRMCTSGQGLKGLPPHPAPHGCSHASHSMPPLNASRSTPGFSVTLPVGTARRYGTA